MAFAVDYYYAASNTTDTSGNLALNVGANLNVDADGAFIFDGLKYGDYIIEITDGDGRPVHRRRITIDRAFYTIDSPIDIKKS